MVRRLVEAPSFDGGGNESWLCVYRGGAKVSRKCGRVLGDVLFVAVLVVVVVVMLLCLPFYVFLYFCTPYGAWARRREQEFEDKVYEVLARNGEMRALEVYEAAEEELQRWISIAAVYSLLHRWEKEGVVTSQQRPILDRNGQPRFASFYRISGSGCRR